ncbi:murein transglycosylase [Arenicella chitinivorans]|uniref:Murein transglycosylase n=1 Tax=Arenicella chitinivorans TaxID=1329800 RepID=A0A918RWJ8_9GAMM|nr:murein transglycosylase [Arenicella chitinivorans]
MVTPVGNYALQCDEIFSCPESLMPRVAFWIEVFSRWDTSTAIFHDKENPHRVYSTVKREEGCRRSKKGDSIDRERKRLKRQLRSLADKVAQNGSLNDADAFLYAQFKDESPSEIRAAADRIRCQSGNKDRMRNALAEYTLYQPTILEALEDQNLTPELQYLPFVESAFNPSALSHVGAAGLWQIMPSTGRTLGLRVDSRIDERYDPIAATYAAALYFRNSVDDLSETAFENGHEVAAKDLNPFVITSYNYGVRGMQRAIKQVGLDYERLLREYKSPSFQTAVKNFYASFLAARHVAKYQDQFFDSIPPSPAARFAEHDDIVLRRATSIKRIASELRVDIDDLRAMNPALKSVIWKHKALVPSGYAIRLPKKTTGWDAQIARMDALPQEVEEAGFVWHRVRRGQTACGIAEQYRASCRALIKLNRLDKRGTIYIGRRIKVPTRSGGIVLAKNASGTTPGTATTQITASSAAHIQTYRVKRGDTSCSIARRNGLRCAEFLALNGLTRGSIIRVGQTVHVTSAGSWHTVRRGQTACGIAESYRVRCSALLDANQLTSTSKILVGQRLRIPSREL